MADQYQEGQTGTGSDGKTYVFTGGQWREEISVPTPTTGVYSLPKAPDKPKESPSGYEPDPNKPGSLRAIPGGPADKPSKVLPEGSAQKLTDDINQVDALSRAINGFQDDYAGSMFTSAESLLQGWNSDIGTPGQRNWWADFKASDNIIRNTLFGASLTPGEKSSYEQTTITPSMDPKTIKENLQKRLGIVQAAAQRRYNRLKAAGYNPEEIDAIVGEVPIFGKSPAPTPDAGGGTTPPAVAPIKAGEAFQTEADLAAQRQLQDAWSRGLSVDEMIQFNQQIGRGAFSPEDIQRMRDARAQNKPEAISFYATPTGQPTAAQGIIGAALETPVGETVGGYAMGAANALTAGTLDELAPILGLDPGRVQAAKDYLRQKSPTAAFAGELTGGILGSIPAVRGTGAALAGTRFAEAAPLLGETAYGAAYGAGEAPEGQRAIGALIGGGAAGAGGALANRFLPGGPGTFTGIAPTPPVAGRFAGEAVPPQQIIEGGREAGIPIMTSDIRPPETFMGRIGQQVGEIVPLGTAGMRRTQQESREQAVETLLADAGVTIDRDIARDLVKNLDVKRKSDIKKYDDMKTEVIDRLASAGDVPAPKSLDAIDSLIAKLEGENLPRQLGGLIGQLQDVKTSLSGPGNLNKIEGNRATLFDLKSDPGLANIATKTEKAWNAVYKALNDDMGDFIKANGDMRDFNRWKVANVKLATMAGELRQGGLKRVLDTGEFNPQTVTRMLTSVNPQEARLLFTNLGKEGRANARLLLLQTAAQKAYDANTGIVNPNTFAREVGRLKSNFGQFFGGAEAERVNGLVAVLNATRRAQEAQFAPRTGERLVPFATAGGFGWLGSALGFDPVTGLASSAAFGAAKRFYESAAARDLLLKISKASGSEKGRLVSDFTQRAAAAAAPIAAERAVGPEAGPPEGAIMVKPQQ